MIGNLSGPTLIVILFIVLLLFGAPKLPALAKSLGQSMKILKKEVTNNEDDAKGGAEASAAPAAAPTEPAAAPAAPAAPVADATASSADDELAKAKAEAAAAKAEADALRAAAEKRAEGSN